MFISYGSVMLVNLPKIPWTIASGLLSWTTLLLNWKTKVRNITSKYIVFVCIVEIPQSLLIDISLGFKS